MHKNVLRSNDYYLLNHLDIVNKHVFLEVLKNDKILLQRNIEDLERLTSNKTKVNRFLEILPKRGPAAFEVFMNALLKSEQTYIYEKLSVCVDNKVLPNFATEESLDYNDSCIQNPNEIGPKRIILLINNNSFENKSLNRVGSENDVKGLKEFFVKTLKYDMFNGKLYHDQKASQMTKLIKEFSSYIKSNAVDLAVVVLMSHGKVNVITGNDGEVVDIQMILNNLSEGTDNVVKLVIFSCCRGEIESLADTPESHINCVHDMVNKPKFRSLLQKCSTPKNSILLYSTQLDYLSYRDRNNSGTIFIQSMLKVFERDYETNDICDMIIKIRTEMGILYKEYDQFPDIKENCKANFRLKCF